MEKLGVDVAAVSGEGGMMLSQYQVSSMGAGRKPGR
jgi:hypothetical protein